MRFRLFLLLIMMAIPPSGAATADMPARLIVIGASYARAWQQPPFGAYTVINKGISGEETSQVLQRFDRDVIAVAPAAVLIWGHINDIHRAPDGDMRAAAEKAKKNLAEMAARAERAGIRVILATEVTLSRPRGPMAAVMEFLGKLRGKQDYQKLVSDQVLEVNRFLRSHAASRRYVLLDLEAALRGSDGYRRPEFDSDDGTHINAAGYAELTRYATGRVPGP